MQTTAIGAPTERGEAAQPTRLFVGVKIATDIAEELAKLVQPLEGLPVRLIPAADLHLTLVPPWNEADISAAIEKLRAFGQLQERPFRPHVTLARLHKMGRAIAGKHPFDQTLSLTQRVKSIELFRSPRKGERGYVVLDSVPLV